MPDFSKLDAVSEEQPVVPHAVPMPDFSKLDAKKEEPDVSADLDTIAAEAMASLNTDSSKETTDELPTVQETYDTDTYVTNETYFGSADNMTYSIPDPAPKTEESAEDDFAAGISGVDPTANGTIPQAPGELFTAPSEFDNVPAADDEFAVTKPEDPASEVMPEETKSVSPFTMIDAEE